MFKFKRKRNSRRRRRPGKCEYQSLEARRCLSSVGWDGVGQGNTELTYYLGDAPAGVEQAVFENAIEKALDVWSDVADIEFKETQTPRLNDSLDITFASLDGASGVLARAYLPDDVNSARIAGDIQFDSSENWEIGNGLGRQAYDLVYVAVHEIGHALGLNHNDVVGSVLKGSVSPNQQFTALAQVDVNAIQSLYAPATTPAPVPVPTSLSNPTIVPPGADNPADGGVGADSQKDPDINHDVDPAKSPSESEPGNRREPNSYRQKRFRFRPTHTFRWGDRTFVVSVNHPILKELAFVVKINPSAFRFV